MASSEHAHGAPAAPAADPLREAGRGMAASGCEIDEFGCAANLDEQGARKGRGDLRLRAWLVSYMALAHAFFGKFD